MSLLDLLACPVCRADVASPGGDALRCGGCAREYPVIGGVPIMLADPSRLTVRHERELAVRPGYDPWVHRMVMQSLTEAHVVVDVGCGNLALDDPCVIRTDVTLTPYVDVVADVHALPFRTESIDFVVALAVLEHLRQPFEAAASIHRVLRRGGYVYGEANFVFAYHGFPEHYFNASIHGLQQLFREFRQVRLGEAPYQMPSFAIESVIGTYLAGFQARTAAEARFADVLRLVLQHPMHHYDTAIPADEAFRVAAGCYFLGQKQDDPGDGVLPRPILDRWEASPELRERFPDPHDLSRPDNLMTWARGAGRADPEIAALLATIAPFSKRPGHDGDRTAIRGLPPIPDPDAARGIGEPGYAEMEANAERRLRELAGVVAVPAAPGAPPRTPGPIRRSLRRLRESAEEAGFRLGLAERRADPPVPPGHLIYLVSGTDNVTWFLESGTAAARGLEGALARQGVVMEELRAILDFGCGVGRVMRHWKDLRRPVLHGTDRTSELIRWCREHLPFARFEVNTIDGTLPHAGESFDLVYAFSVFTHLPEQLQEHWITELSRVLRPGGYLYLTTHGERYLPHVPEDRREAFNRGQLVVGGDERPGSNLCAAFHPEVWVRMILARDLLVVEHVPGEYPQDAYLLMKPR